MDAQMMKQEQKNWIDILIERAESMITRRECTVCKAECIGKFGEQPNFVTSDGVKMPKYLVAGLDHQFATIFCEHCDWKISQAALGNKSAWATFSHEFKEIHVYLWGKANGYGGDEFVTEVKRLRRNETARLRRAAKKAEKKD